VSTLQEREDLPRYFLAAAMLAAATMIWFETKDQTFWSDELTRLYARPGLTLNSLLAPEQGNLVLGSVLVTKAFAAVFGTDHALWRLVTIALNLTCSGLLYVWLRRRVGAWYAVLPASLILVLGAGGELIATTAGSASLIPVAAGLGALLVLERRDLLGDGIACALLVIALATYSAGVAFVIAATVVISLRPPPERWTRAWVWVIPVALLVAWRVWVELSDPPLLSYPLPDQFSLSNLYMIPSFAIRALAGVCAALTGLFPVNRTPGMGFDPALGIALAIGLIALVGWRMSEGGATLRRLLVVTLPPLALWTSVALTYVPGLRDPTSIRYVYFGSVLIILVLGELARGLAITPRRFAVAAGIWFVALVPNLFQLHYQAQYTAGTARVTKAKLTALELARGQVDRGFHPEGPEIIARNDTTFAIGPAVTAGGYFDSIDAWGSPAFTVPELESQGPGPRAQADLLLAEALGLKLEPGGPFPPSPPPVELQATGRVVHAPPGCLSLRPSSPLASYLLELPARGIAVTATGGAPANVSIGRFGDATGFALGIVSAGAPAELRLYPDGADRPWRATIASAGPVRVCGLGGRGAR
jgi:hypothetical protein